MRKFSLIVLIVFIAILSSAITAFAVNDSFKGFPTVNLEVNGQAVDAPAINIDGTTFIPVRDAGEALNCEVDWKNETNTVIINDKEKASTSGSSGGNDMEKIGQFKLKTDVFDASYVREVEFYKDENDSYVSLGAFKNHGRYEDGIATLKLPGKNEIKIYRENEYPKGENGSLYNDGIIVKLSALGLKPTIEGNTLYLESE